MISAYFLYDLNFFNNDRSFGHVGKVSVCAGSDSGDLVNDFDALSNLTERGILSVKMRSILVHNKELRRSGVWSHGTSH